VALLSISLSRSLSLSLSLPLSPPVKRLYVKRLSLSQVALLPVLMAWPALTVNMARSKAQHPSPYTLHPTPCTGVMLEGVGCREWRSMRSASAAPLPAPPAEREFFIDYLLVRVHFIIEMIWWTGLAPWEFEPPFPQSSWPGPILYENRCNLEMSHMKSYSVE
jgi:hypothetical protein